MELRELGLISVMVALLIAGFALSLFFKAKPAHPVHIIILLVALVVLSFDAENPFGIFLPPEQGVFGALLQQIAARPAWIFLKECNDVLGCRVWRLRAVIVPAGKFARDRIAHVLHQRPRAGEFLLIGQLDEILELLDIASAVVA
jgi:hypothetical protein